MKKYYIWFSLAMQAGNIRSATALEYFGNPINIYNSDYKERKESGIFTANELKRLENTKLITAENILSECEKYRIDVITIDDKKYPYCLSVIENPPVVLYVKGEMQNFDEIPTVCIVGPRNVSDFGKKAAYSLANRLSKAGFLIVSGGAVGSDYYAHLGALKAGGKTALVMGCGTESGYLPENEPLRKSVSENGCIITEHPPKMGVTKFSFPVRNRIMSALSLATVVIEAGKKSGSLITANCALNQGKDVFVIPGSPSAEEYVGSNALLRDGAKPLIDASDIFNEYIPRFPEKIDIKKAYREKEKKTEKTVKKEVNKNLSIEPLSKNAKIVYNHLDKHTFYPEEISDTGLNSGEILSALTELEIEFIIRALPGGRYEII